MRINSAVTSYGSSKTVVKEDRLQIGCVELCERVIILYSLCTRTGFFSQGLAN